MLKIGSIILSISGGLRLIASVLSLLISLIGKHAPILKMVFTDDEIFTLDSKVIVTTKSLAILHNSGAVICTFLTLIIIWTSLINGYKWAFCVLLVTGFFGHIILTYVRPVHYFGLV
jgi:hypothetical protein